MTHVFLQPLILGPSKNLILHRLNYASIQAADSEEALGHHVVNPPHSAEI